MTPSSSRRPNVNLELRVAKWLKRLLDWKSTRASRPSDAAALFNVAHLADVIILSLNDISRGECPPGSRG